jgi:hypothetical protein
MNDTVTKSLGKCVHYKEEHIFGHLFPGSSKTNLRLNTDYNHFLANRNFKTVLTLFHSKRIWRLSDHRISYREWTNSCLAKFYHIRLLRAFDIYDNDDWRLWVKYRGKRRNSVRKLAMSTIFHWRVTKEIGNVTILKSVFESEDNLVLFQYELQEILFNTRNWMPSIQLLLWVIHIK